MKQKWIPGLLLLLFVLLVPAGTARASVIGSGTCGDGLTWTFDSYGVLTISGTGAMTDFRDPDGTTRPFAPWGGEYYAIEKVVVEEGCTHIGSYAFYGCRNLTEAQLPDSVTGIGDCAFSDCKKLQDLNFSPALVSAGSHAFMNCGFTSVTLADGWTEIPYGLFWGCSALEHIGLPDSLEKIGEYAFYDCKALTGLQIPDGVTEIGTSAFGYCEALEEIAVPAGVGEIPDSVFTRCTSLRTVSLPEGLEQIGKYVFMWDRSLQSVTVPETVRRLDYEVFRECTALEELVLPKNIEVIPYALCQKCTALKKVTIPVCVSAIDEQAFDDCESITDVYYEGTEEDWNNIFIDKLNVPLLVGPQIHYQGAYYERFSIEGAGIAPVPDQLFTGREVKPSVTVTKDGKELTEGRDYVLSYENNVEQGTATVTVTGRFDYYGQVTGTFRIVADKEFRFKDVAPGKGYYKAVRWAYYNGIVSGTSPDTFSPGKGCTRAQFVMMLYRYAGKPDVSGLTHPFTDVKKGKGYYDAVTWAYNRRIVAGTSKTKFSPGATLTRAQIVLMLYRYAGRRGIRGMTMKFTDVTKDKGYYRAVMWTSNLGIVSGTSPETFSPGRKCTRAQLAMMLYRFETKYKNP